MGAVLGAVPEGSLCSPPGAGDENHLCPSCCGQKHSSSGEGTAGVWDCLAVPASEGRGFIPCKQGGCSHADTPPGTFPPRSSLGGDPRSGRGAWGSAPGGT